VIAKGDTYDLAGVITGPGILRTRGLVRSKGDDLDPVVRQMASDLGPRFYRSIQPERDSTWNS